MILFAQFFGFAILLFYFIYISLNFMKNTRSKRQSVATTLPNNKQPLKKTLPLLPLLCVLGVSTPVLNGCTSINNLFNDKKATERGIAKESEEAYFKKAQKDIARKRYTDAEKALDDLRTFYPVGLYSKQALLDLIYVKFQKGEYQQAALVADRFIKNYPSHQQVDYAWYAKGVANMNGGFSGLMKFTNLNQAHRDTSFLRAAFVDFENLVQRFPNSRYTPDAVQRMYHIYNQFAEHEINVARFNLKRKAYLGAAERAKTVFLGFPQSPQTPEAIATLAYAYGKLGMTDHEAKYKKLLQANYPHLLQGDSVRLAAARTGASWLNRMSLGLFGQAASTSTANSLANSSSIAQTATPAAENNPLAMPKLPPQVQPTPQKSRKGLLPSANLSLGLGLPNDDGTAATPAADPKPTN